MAKTKPAVRPKFRGQSEHLEEMDEIKPKRGVLTYFPIMYWIITGLLVWMSGWFASVTFKAGNSIDGWKLVWVTAVFIGVSPLIWLAADWLRRYAAPTFYIGNGFWDMVKLRLFWSVGPQLIGLVLAMLLLIEAFGAKIPDLKNSTASTTHAVLANKASQPKRHFHPSGSH